MTFNKKMIYALLLGLGWAHQGFSQNQIGLTSPNSKLEVTIRLGEKATYALSYAGKELMRPSALSLDLGDGKHLGWHPVLENKTLQSINRTLVPPIRQKRKIVVDRYNELRLHLKGNYGLIFRAYNDGMAYRFFTEMAGNIKVFDEEAIFSFPRNETGYFPVLHCEGRQKQGVDCFHTSYEEVYQVLPLNALKSGELSLLPALINPEIGPKILITEADLVDYPGMYLTGSADGTLSLRGRFPAFPLEEKTVGEEFPQRLVTKRAEYLAETRGTREFPWRVLLVAERDADLIESDLVYRLGGEPVSADFSWIKPGKSQSEWLHDNILYGVDFKSGYNTETYKFYADYLARFGLEYLFFDAGWSKVTDVFQLTPTMNMEEIIRYAQSKGLGVVLWVSAIAMNQQLIPALDQFQKWGISGIQVDFMDRDDQSMVNFYERVVAEAAKRHIIVDFHGAFKPTGLERKYPNAITREALVAFEYDKWQEFLTPEYEVTVPFIRMVAGALDYEPGQMLNAQKEDFRMVGRHPMSQGTRIHQLAMFIIYESPYAKMGGNPADCQREPEYTRFMARIPTVWDETRVLEAKLADYVVLLRQSAAGDYYIGAMTDWTPRQLTLDLSFLDAGKYQIEIYEDGPNADRYGIDYRHRLDPVTRDSRLNLTMAPGGGWVAKITRFSSTGQAGIKEEILPQRP